MNDLIDIGAGIIILLLISLFWLIHERERKRVQKLMDESVGEKYMQLMAAFMKRDGARLIDMTQNSADMKIIAGYSEENFSIFQTEKGVHINWSLSTVASKLSREFKFTNNETQEEIMEAVASEIIEAKKEV